MLRSPIKVFELEPTSTGIQEQNVTAGSGGPSSIIGRSLPSNNVVSTTLSVNHPIVLSENTYTKKSSHLLRNIYVLISNEKGETFTLKDCKIDMQGKKYIGIQQDMFSITVKNINLQAFAMAVNNGYIYVRFVADERVVFAGSIKNINTARENIVERTMTLNCLMKVTDLLSDMVSPIGVNSSMNIWHALSLIDPYLTVIAPDELKDLKFDKNYVFTGQKKTVIDDIIRTLNNQLNRMNMKDLPWLEYEFQQDGTLSLFGPTDHIEVLNVQPFTGLTDAPTVADTEVSFNSVYKHKLVPGRVVKLDNALFATSGTDSAYIYAFDEQGLYVITEVAYSFSNYPWAFKCSCKARPLSKYQNFVTRG